MNLAAIAYTLLAVDHFAKSRAAGPRGGGLAGLGDVGTGLEVAPSAIGNLFAQPEIARRMSPTFQKGAAIGRVEPGQSIEHRAKRIAQLVKEGARDPAVRRQAGWILAQRKPDGSWAVAEKDWKGEADAIYHWVRKNMRYTRDHATIDQYAHPARTLFDRPAGVGAIGDCDDAAATGGALLAAVGHQPVLRIVAAKQGGLANPDYNHIFLGVRLPTGGVVSDGRQGAFYPLDMSISKGPGWQPPKEMIAKYRDFEVQL